MNPYTRVFSGLVLAACLPGGAIGEYTANSCEGIPRPANASLPLSRASDEWFRVYETAPGVYSIVEPYHYQETISHLIVGKRRALLFDTGMGFLPIRPVVERLTRLPVTVFNSHTHYDHVGGNGEFAEVLAIDSAYTRNNMTGFRHERVSGDLGPDAFCKGTPPKFDRTAFRTRPWRATRYVKDGEIIDLGGRRLRVLHVPGHTPDAAALLDAEHGLLFTGDSYYDGAIWLFVPETSLDHYETSIARLAQIEREVKYLLGAHNAARVDANVLGKVKAAFGKLISGDVGPTEDDDGRLLFEIDGVEFLTARPVLEGRQGDTSAGGSGLETWE